MKFIKPPEGISVKRMIQAAIGDMEPPRSYAEIHASDLTREELEFCPRERVLHVKLGTENPGRFVNSTMRITFDTGHAVQSLINNKWLRHRMVGHWRCTACQTDTDGKAPECGMSDCQAKYREVQVRHSLYQNFTGSLDGLVDVGEPKYRMIEIKIVDKDYYRKLLAPLAEHRTRTNLYMRLVAESDSPWAALINTDVAHLLYVERGYGLKDETGFITPLKEYLIKRDDSATDVYMARAKAAQGGLMGGDMPQRICSNVTCTRASSCAVRTECFSGDH